MLNENEIIVHRTKFFEENSPYFRKLQKSAMDIASQNVPAYVFSKDVLMRKWFSELVCFFKFKTVSNLAYIPCSIFSGEEVFQAIKNQPSDSCILLDKVDCLSLDFQNGLLDAFSNKYFENKNISIITGSSENLDKLSEQNLFSKSLCFRLNLLKVNIASLNEIHSEILPLARYFLEAKNKELGARFEGFSDRAEIALQKHFWKGDASELKNVIERAVIFGEPPYISVKDFGFEMTGSNDVASDIADGLTEDKSLKTAVDSFKRYYVKKILEENGNNQTKTAKVLGLQRTYVARLMNELNLR